MFFREYQFRMMMMGVMVFASLALHAQHPGDPNLNSVTFQHGGRGPNNPDPGNGPQVPINVALALLFAAGVGL